jgi:hypothetical protein
MSLGISKLLKQQLPQLEECSAIPMGKHDVLIHAPGFEDRTMAVVQSIVPSPDARVVLLDYRPYNVKNRLSDVREALGSRGVPISETDILLYDRFDPEGFEARLRHHLLLNRIQRVLIDISTMSKLAILLTLSVCRDLDVEVTILYTEAKAYGPSREEFEKAKENNEIHRPTLQIFTGVHGVVRVTSLASVAMQGQPTAALVFMSFNDALTQVLLNTVYPSRLFLINGRPPVHNWREKATAWIHDQVRREWEEDNPVRVTSAGSIPVPQRAVSTLEYRETVSLLIGLYWQLSATHRVLLAPGGSKMQAVGCYLAKALHPDIHIEYPSPEGFQPEYSSGIAARWTLNLGRLNQLLDTVSVLERREFLELSVS